MRRILILDRNHEQRAQLIDALQRAANVETVIVDTDVKLISRIYYGIYAAVFADDELLNDKIGEVVNAVRSAIARPMLIVASNDTHRDLEADLVTLVIRKPYDVSMVTGILLSAVFGMPGPSGAAEGDTTVRTK